MRTISKCRRTAARRVPLESLPTAGLVKDGRGRIAPVKVGPRKDGTTTSAPRVKAAPRHPSGTARKVRLQMPHAQPARSTTMRGPHGPQARAVQVVQVVQVGREHLQGRTRTTRKRSTASPDRCPGNLLPTPGNPPLQARRATSPAGSALRVCSADAKVECTQRHATL